MKTLGLRFWLAFLSKEDSCPLIKSKRNWSIWKDWFLLYFIIVSKYWPLFSFPWNIEILKQWQYWPVTSLRISNYWSSNFWEYCPAISLRIFKYWNSDFWGYWPVISLRISKYGNSDFWGYWPVISLVSQHLRRKVGWSANHWLSETQICWESFKRNIGHIFLKEYKLINL